MLNLTLSERNYLVELIRKDQKEKNPISNQFYVDADGLIQYLEGQSFVDTEIATEHEEIDLCPSCSVYCTERFVDGQCK